MECSFDSLRYSASIRISFAEYLRCFTALLCTVSLVFETLRITSFSSFSASNGNSRRSPPSTQLSSLMVILLVAGAALTVQGHPWTEATSFATGSSLSLPQLSMHTSTFPTSILGGSLTTSTMTFDNHLPQAQTKSFPSHLGSDCRAHSFQDELFEQVARHDQLDVKKEDEKQHVQLQQTFCELAEYLAHLRKIRQKLRRRKSAQELEKLEVQLRNHNAIATSTTII